MFDGQIVAVTGAKGGIGFAIAEMFKAGGATVAISDLEVPYVDGFHGYACNVAKEDSVKSFIEDVEKDLGPIDVYISNAGIGRGDGKHMNVGSVDGGWQLSWDVNVMGSVYAARYLVPKWRERGSGRMAIVASAAGLLCQMGSSSYTATKHAAVGLSESLYISHKEHGIMTHCVCPQYVRTDMTKGHAFAENSPDGYLEPSDVANALKKAIEEDRFMVLSHPQVKNYFQMKAADYDGWLNGMVELKQKFGGSMTLPSATEKEA